MQSDPARARAAGLEALAAARHENDPAAEVAAHRALGLAAREAHDVDASSRHLRRAVRTARRHGLEREAAQARMSLSGTLALAGKLRQALAEADLAAGALAGVDRARLEMQRSSILLVQGRFDEALAGYRRARPALAEAGDRANEATLLANRGLTQAQLGNLRAAAADLRAAEQRYLELGHDRAAADVRQNLGFVAARAGDLPTALAAFARADAFLQERGWTDPFALRDRCEALLSARLVSEAREAAEQAVAGLLEAGLLTSVPEARLLLAEAVLLDGDAETAGDQARTAAGEFSRQGRRPYRALADAVAARAAVQAGACSPALLRTVRRAADELGDTGWVAAAVDARLLAGRLAADLGRPGVARRELAAAAAARRRGPVAVRARGWQAEALLRLSRGDQAGAGRAACAGVRLLDRYRAALAAGDLRARASGHGAGLASVGLGLALDSGDAWRVLSWAERWRAQALQPRPVRPPADPVLAAELAELRRVAADAERAAATGSGSDRLLRRQARLEASVRDRARLVGRGEPDGVAPAGRDAAATGRLRDLRDLLGERALVEFVGSDGALAAVVVAGGRATVHAVGPERAVAGELESLRFSLRRLAARRGGEASRAAAAATVRHAAARLDDVLLGPLRRRLGDAAAVVVPTGALHAVPWSTLPGLNGRPLTVAPSAALFARAMTAQRPAASATVLIAGPLLAAADAEVRALARRYPAATTLWGDAATASAACRALDGAGLAHVAAHGRFRRDNPLFSSLQLADGPLTVYDLDGMRTPPDALVLSACDSGVSEVSAGDELLGLTAALLGAGTRTVVASVLPVPDAETLALMLDLHAGLARGDPLAVALADAQRRSTGADPRAAAAGAAFVCFGAG